jgi:hypothetical protein
MITGQHRTALRWLAGLLALMLVGPVWGRVEVTPVADIDLGSWDPSVGSLTGASSFCVLSTQGNRDIPRDYRMRLIPQSSGLLELVSTIDPAQRIPILVYFDDLLTPSSEQLQANVWSTRDKQGVISCDPIQLNAQIRVALDAANIGAVVAGPYQAAFTLVEGASGRDVATFVVSVTISEAVWIQNLDPIPLAYSVGSDAVGNEPFCIWSSTGAYDLTISSTTPTAAPVFLASGQTVAANTVSYTVLFDTDTDASDGVTVTEGVLIGNQPSSGLPSCLSDNAAIRVGFAEPANLAVAPADTYQDQLTLLVEPQ